MLYTSFLNCVTNCLKARLGDSFLVSVEQIPKNNGTAADALCIRHKLESASPTIYLKPYYDAFCSGIPLNDILDHILELYRSTILPSSMNLTPLNTLSDIQTKVVFRAINASANRSLLSSSPHAIWPDLDLAFVFYLFLLDSQEGQLASLITRENQQSWKVSDRQLLELSMTNTPRLLPLSFQSLSQVIGQDLGSSSSCYDASFPLYVLSNRNGIYGAGAMFYPNALSRAAIVMKCEKLFILPSSVHEVLLTPYWEQISCRQLADTVYQINTEEVPVEDRLSNHIYTYSLKERKLSLAFHSPCPIETENPSEKQQEQ